jgi:hypothetical protein
MADPLSIAASVVGVVTVGVQISVKLYALGEKIATASQRVTSIANDISSTCAILNQLHDLMTPKPDASGNPCSVFNATALKDITHALRHCEAVFNEIAKYQEQASKQIKGRSRPHTKIQLSRTEKAKWPFLQPQFDELRGDLRDSKGNLLLMITVASLALMQKGGQQQPVDSAEEAELKATIVDLASARSPKPKPKPTANGSNDAHGFAKLLRKLGTSKPTKQVHKGSDRGIGDGPRQRTIQAIAMPEESVEWQAPQSPELALSSLRSEPNEQFERDLTDLESLSSYKTTIPSRPPSTRSVEGPPAKLSVVSPVIEHALGDRELTGFLTQNTNEVHIKNNNTHEFQNDIATLQTIEHDVLYSRNEPQDIRQHLFDSRGMLLNYQTDPEYQESKHREDVLQAWTTSVLPGLSTGFGPCMEVIQLNFPQDEIRRMLQKYTTTGYELHETFLKLNSQQRDLVSSYSTRSGGTLVYVDKSREEVVSTVFGSLTIMVLIWITSAPRHRTKTRKSSVDPRRNLRDAHGQALTAPPGPVLPMLARTRLGGTRTISEESLSTNPSIVQGPLGAVHDPWNSGIYEKTSQAGSRPSPMQSEGSYNVEQRTPRYEGLAREPQEDLLIASEDPFTGTRHTRHLDGTRHLASQSTHIRSPQDIMRERKEREEQRHGPLPASRTPTRAVYEPARDEGYEASKRDDASNFTQKLSVESLYDTATSAAVRSRSYDIPSADRWAAIRGNSEALSSVEQRPYASTSPPLPTASHLALPPSRQPQSLTQPERYISPRPHQPQGVQWKDEGYTSGLPNAQPPADDMMPEIGYGMDDDFSISEPEAAQPTHILPSDPFGNQAPRCRARGRGAPDQGKRTREDNFAVRVNADADANAIVEELLRKWTI